MRRMVIILAVAVLCSAGCAAEKETGLVLHYTFDKGADSTIQDQSGHGNNGAILGGTKWATGEFGSALELNGADGYVDCGAKPSLNICKAWHCWKCWHVVLSFMCKKNFALYPLRRDMLSDHLHKGL